MNSGIIIRGAEIADAPAICVMLEKICRIHCEGRPDIFRESKKYCENDIETLLEDKNCRVFVAQADSKVVAYAICMIKHGSKVPVLRDFVSVYVDDLFVDEDYRRRGVGRKLFEHIKQMAVSENAHNIDLNVWAFNKGAISFYRSLGMKPERIYMETILDKKSDKKANKQPD